MNAAANGLLRAHFKDGRSARRAAEELQLAGFGADQIELDEGHPPIFEELLPAEERHPRSGQVAVHAEGRQLEAAAILHRHGGLDLADSPRVEHRTPQTGGLAMELRSEAAQPQIRAVQVGEVRIRKVVVTETRLIEVELRREELEIERLPAPEPARDRGRRARGPAPFASDEVMRIPLYAEEVEIVKRPVVREEVIVRKRPLARTVSVPTRLRREEPQITSTGPLVTRELTPR